MSWETCVACVLLCGALVVGSGVNDFASSTLKFSTADPKTPLARPHFLAAAMGSATDGDERRSLVTTATRQRSEMYDMSAAGTVYRETADGREYRERAPPPRPHYPNAWQPYPARKKIITHGAYNKPYKTTANKSPNWEPSVYTPSNKYHLNHYTEKPNNVHVSNEPQWNTGFNVYERPQSQFEHTFANLKFQEPFSPLTQQENHQVFQSYQNLQNEPKRQVTSKDRKPKVVKPEVPPKVEDEEDDSDDEEEENEFVPMRMYAQVRQYESESHLPTSVEEPRLRKIVKDSRIHTVYMEEGYEDGAYDHAGEEKHAEKEEAQVEHRRRRSIDLTVPSVDIDDVIGKNQYELGQSADNAAKYPYYDKRNINSNSPLRYAQAIRDMPNKRENSMAFYEDAETKTKCEEVVETVAPIPKELDDGKQPSEKSMIPNLPRLRNLGDKIDCYKIKFFGEEPLDNPLFKEELIEQPKELSAEPEVRATAEYLKHANRTGKTLSALGADESRDSDGMELADGRNQDVSDGHAAPGELGAADADVDVGVAAETAFQPLPEAEALRMQRITRPRKRLYRRNKLNSSRYAAYRPLRKSHQSHKPPRGSTPPPPASLAAAALAPNVISEVYYKQDIKPSEQLNVFADVINHIQNMSRDDALMAASEQRPHVVVATPPSTSTRPNSIHNRQSIRQRKKSHQRKRKVMKSTQQLYTDYMQRNATNNPSRIQNDITPLTQESNLNVGTVHVPSSYNSLDFHASYEDNTEVPKLYTTIDVPLNKYLVPGMKPPLAIEKPMIYSEFQSNNILKRRDWLSNHRLVRRKRGTRNNYSEIRRQPASKPQESPDDDDIDDYVPHRPTNYHYDPDTDRIIYDKKPTSERTVEEIVEEYFEEEPEPPEPSTTKKPPPPHKTVYHKDVLNQANGKTLVDYLAALRADPSYKVIEDPKPTKDPPTTTTVSSASTTPPEFLKFLEKLHSSEGYKKIENPEDKPVEKKPKTTTTEATMIEEAEEQKDEEPVQASSIQNSPGGQFEQDGGLQIFDINDYLPKVKTYTPRTSIDYSKYKTIERTTSRHSLSSRYSEEDELPLEKSTEAPQALKYQTAPPRPKPTTPAAEEEEEDEEVVEVPATTTTTTTTTTTPTSTPKIRVRTRQRPSRPTRVTTTTTTTTAKPQAVDTGSDVETTERPVVYTPATHRPPSRVYPRRQRPKIRLRSTTTPASVAPNQDAAVDSDEEPSEARRRTIVRRRQHTLPANHKPDYTPVTISKRMDDLPTMLMQRQARLVTPEIINYNQTAAAGGARSRPGEINPRMLARLTTPEARVATGGDKDARAPQINSAGVDLSRDDGALPSIDRSDHHVGVKFIKDPNKRLYFYAPL